MNLFLKIKKPQGSYEFLSIINLLLTIRFFNYCHIKLKITKLDYIKSCYANIFRPPRNA